METTTTSDRADQRDELALPDDALDAAQRDAGAWIGVGRDPDALPITPAALPVGSSS